MTSLNRPVTRVLASEGRALVVTLEPGGLLTFREQGTRRRYTLSLRVLFQRAVQSEVDAARAAKRRRKGRRG